MMRPLTGSFGYSDNVVTSKVLQYLTVRNEMYAWILRSFKALSKEDSDERFDETDTDENGFISWDEYKSEEFDFDDGELDMDDDSVKEELLLMEEDKMLFDAADINSDGNLDKAEFLSFSHPEEDPTMNPHVVDQVLKEKDADKNGEVSFQEYIGDRGKDKDKEWLIEEKERFDNELDKNGDNILSREEIIAWIIPSNEDIAKEEVHIYTNDTSIIHHIHFKYRRLIICLPGLMRTWMISSSLARFSRIMNSLLDLRQQTMVPI